MHGLWGRGSYTDIHLLFPLYACSRPVCNANYGSFLTLFANTPAGLPLPSGSLSSFVFQSGNNLSNISLIHLYLKSISNQKIRLICKIF
jgi:hypothetical protein